MGIYNGVDMSPRMQDMTEPEGRRSTVHRSTSASRRYCDVANVVVLKASVSIILGGMKVK